MNTSRNDEFYIGYQKQAPAGLAHFLRRRVLLLIVAGTGLAALLPNLLTPAEPGRFEYGSLREVRGVIREAPYPSLWVERSAPGTAAGSAWSSYDLVSVGKWGAQAEVRGFDGSSVEVRGTLIERPGGRMLELARGGVERDGAGTPLPAIEDLGEITLTGEIVDSKCYLGVMKPGRGTVHRDCAVRCISGGVPPVFVVAAREGEPLQLLLVDQNGGAVNQRVLDMVAEPLAITGRLRRMGGRLLFAADPSTYRRLEDT